MNIQEILGIETDIPQDKVDALMQSIKSNLLENEDFIKSIPKEKLPKELTQDYFNQGVAKVFGQTRNTVLKELGMSDSDLAELPEEDRAKIEKIIPFVANKFKSKQPNHNANIAELERKFLEAQNSLTEKEQLLETQKNSTKTEIENALKQQAIDFKAFQNSVKVKENVLGDFGIMFNVAYNSIKDKYALVENGSDIEIRKKDNPTFKVTETIDGKETFLTFDKAVELEFKKIGIWKDAQATPTAGDPQKFPLSFGSDANNSLINEMKKYTS